MKTIRYNVFETNSSSTHSMVVLDEEDYNRWVNEGLYYDSNAKELLTLEDIRFLVRQDMVRYRKRCEPEKVLDKITDDEVDDYLSDNYWDYPESYEGFTSSEYLEYDTNYYTTKKGEKFVMVCKYGHD